MGSKKKINNFRRKLMGRLTSNVGKKYQLQSQRIENIEAVKHILVVRPNHRLGNLLMLTPLLQELEMVFPNAKVDIFAKGGISPTLFQNYKKVNRIVQLPRKPFKALGSYIKKLFFLKNKKYDLVINADENSSSGKLFTKHARGTVKIFGDLDAKIIEQNEGALHMAQQPVFCLRQLLKQSGEEISSPIPGLDLKLSQKELENGLAVLKSHVDTTKPTLSIFTFATGNKCYSKAWWNEVYNELLSVFPEYNILEVLPVENVSQIDFKAPSYYSKDVREIAALLANTSIFVGADSGMMHLSCASGVQTVGLFAVTKEKKYRPYGGRNFAIKTTEGNAKEWAQQIKASLD